MWSDRRLVDLLGVEHPLVLSSMPGLGTVELAFNLTSCLISVTAFWPKRASSIPYRLRDRATGPRELCEIAIRARLIRARDPTPAVARGLAVYWLWDAAVKKSAPFAKSAATPR